MKVWIDGRFVPAGEARVGFFDAGFQHAIGLFETLLARDGAILRLEAHLERLAASARELRLFDPLRIEPLAEAVHATLAENCLRDARIRVTLSAGDMGRPFAGANAAGDAPPAPMPTVAPRASRWLRAVRPLSTLLASSSAPTSARGAGAVT